MPLHEVVVALGANLGDPAAQVRSAMDQLAGLNEGQMLRSSLWQSEPVDMSDQSGIFVNAVAVFETSLPPMQLLRALQQIEADFGRPGEHERYVARPLDLDLIAYGEKKIDEPDLEVPHPRAAERLFVLLPLREVKPDFRLPGEGVALDALIASAPAMAISRL